MVIQRILKAISLLNIIIMIVTPIAYRTENLVIGNLNEKVYTLTLNMDHPNIEMSNVLSYDVLFGYEKTSEMAKRKGALFAVNGMFYNQYGEPYGILIEDGKMIHMNSIGTPCLIITPENKLSIEEITITGQVSSGENVFNLLGTNTAVYGNTCVLFDATYGSSTRVQRESVNYLITDNQIIDIIVSEQPVTLKSSDYVLTEITADNQKRLDIGDLVQIDFTYSNGLENVDKAFQSGGWLVKEGKNVAKDLEPFMGPTTAPSPRTLVGVTEDQKLIFKVIDGREPSVSAGVSGYYAAELMLSEGCISAAYLDGGASSTMVIEGQVVNKPSNGEEREVAHGIMIDFRKLELQ